MYQIAVLVGEKGETIAFSDSGMIKVFTRNEQKKWEVIEEMVYEPDGNSGIKEMRAELLNIANQLESCKVIAVKEASGIAYNVFETMHFDIWEFEGMPESFLDSIASQEDEERHICIQKYQDAKRKENRLEGSHEEQDKDLVKKTSKNEYVIDLLKAQSGCRNLSSKQIIMPLLKQGSFIKLDIICDHIPPWLEKQIGFYGLKMKIEYLGQDLHRVSLFY